MRVIGVHTTHETSTRTYQYVRVYNANTTPQQQQLAANERRSFLSPRDQAPRVRAQVTSSLSGVLRVVYEYIVFSPGEHELQLWWSKHAALYIKKAFSSSDRYGLLLLIVLRLLPARDHINPWYARSKYIVLVLHKACKDEFRPNPRSHSVVFNFIPGISVGARQSPNPNLKQQQTQHAAAVPPIKCTPGINKKRHLS